MATMDQAQAIQIWQEEQVLRTTRSLGYDPLLLPRDDKKRNFVVKSLIRSRCEKNHPVKMRASMFNKAWDRMIGRVPAELKYVVVSITDD